MSWQHKAKCKGKSLADFYPIGRTGRIPVGGSKRDTEHAQKQAAKFCDGCEVKKECLEWALINGEDGVWGGTTEGERRYMISKRKKIVA